MYPKKIGHWVKDEEISEGGFFEKLNPSTGQVLALVASGDKSVIDMAVDVAVNAAKSWRETNVVKRSEIVRKAALELLASKAEIAETIAIETGKSYKDAMGEVGAAIEMAFFVAGEGRRYYGKTTTSAVPNRFAMTVRQPIGVCGLITPANTPIANIAWKVFPALLCGNTVVLKPPEDAPNTALLFARLLHKAGLSRGVLSVVQGLGHEAGAALVQHEDVKLISFTGSVQAGKNIQELAGKRLAKVCLELGGKNPLVVCDDADLDVAVEDAVASAFSNAGQRCASGSRLIVFAEVYEEFKRKLIARIEGLKVGFGDQFDLGPVINERQFKNILNAIRAAEGDEHMKILIGGKPANEAGYFIEPTVIEASDRKGVMWRNEIFGPVTLLHEVSGFSEALEAANDSGFALTASIHSRSVHRTQEFIDKCVTGVVYVNGPTFGSEPHMPFGGLKDSGNGFREAGTEALDVYSELKTVYIKHNPELA